MIIPFIILMTPAFLLILSLCIEGRYDRLSDWLEAIAFLGFMFNFYLIIT